MMVNQLSKFILNCANLLHPLNALLSKNAWKWGPSQEEAFTAPKEKLFKLITFKIQSSDLWHQ